MKSRPLFIFPDVDIFIKLTSWKDLYCPPVYWLDIHLFNGSYNNQLTYKYLH